MKITIITILSALFVLLTVCCTEDFIDIQPKGKLSSSAFDAEKAVVGCYAAYYRNEYSDNDSYYSMWPLSSPGKYLSDDNYSGGFGLTDLGNGEGHLEQTFMTFPTYSFVVQDCWDRYYDLISAYNYTIQGLNELGQSDISDTLKNRYLAEVRFLRAWAYMRLMLIYGTASDAVEDNQGGVVLVDENVTSESAPDLIRSSYDDSWNFIIDELVFAEKYLPAKSQYEISDLGRVTKGAAQGMLARAYMHFLPTQWDRVESYAMKVINSGEYSLEPDFKYVWNHGHDNGTESLFEISYAIVASDAGEATSHGSYWAQAENPRNPFNIGWGCMNITRDLLYEFEEDPGDPRIIWTFLVEGDTDITVFTKPVLKDINWFAPDKLHNRKCWFTSKYKGPNNGIAEFNLKELRYADVLLMAAEAFNENGSTAEALTYLNMIRERAGKSSIIDTTRIPIITTSNNTSGYPSFPMDGMTPEERVPLVTATSQDKLREAIWHERRVELACEGYRYFDLVRQGRAGQVMRAFYEKYQDNCQDKGRYFEDGKHECLPIPETEITMSKGLIKQNPGY